MKTLCCDLKHVFLWLVFTFLFIIYSAVCCTAQVQSGVRQEAQQLKKVLSEYHVHNPSFDDQFSSRVFRTILTQLDPDRHYLTKADISKLKSFETKIDDDLVNNTWTFFPALSSLYKTALLRSESNFNSFSKQAIGLEKKEFLRFDTTWAENEASLTQRQRLAFKSEVMERMQLTKITNLGSAEEAARKKVAQLKLQDIKRVLSHPSGFENYLGSFFLRSICLSLDPHSNYLSPVEMQNFVSALSSDGYFGVQLDEDSKGNVVVQRIVPGGPAWKSGEVHAGDVIEELSWNGKDVIDAEGLSQDEIDQILTESNEGTLHIKLRKPGGVTENIKLKKEKLSTEQDVLKEILLDGDQKIGFISLPDFYSNWDDGNGSACANDVAKAIVKLKKLNIQGLIIDLRFNGGGSMEEAIALAGIFIDAGPVGLVKTKTGEVFTAKDQNRGAIWDGPLVIMVNGLSASASEFFTAALQDYNRAIVLGDKTYGKGTAQGMFSLQPNKAQVDFKNIGKVNNGYATVTTGRFYRITGKTTQYDGVTPDILIDDPYDFSTYQERQMPYAFRPDVVSKKVYYQPLPALPLQQLKLKSSERMDTSKVFKSILEMKSLIADIDHDTTAIDLQWSVYSKTTTTEETEVTERSEVLGKDSPFKVSFLSSDEQRMQLDEYLRELNNSWRNNLSNDFYLKEAYHVISDYITLLQNNH
jgi:carboxyl-terminal processing protease